MRSETHRPGHVAPSGLEKELFQIAISTVVSSRNC